MAGYKVPQDVEADDKLIGPFSFRQFIYLFVVALCIAACWGLYQVFPLLVVIPLPFILFFGALALPLRKDQPMEVYMAAMVSYYLKPRKRMWDPDGIDSLIEITAPKVVEHQLTKNLSQTEAEQRLGYLARLVDTRGWSVRGQGVEAPNTPLNAEVYFDAQSTEDILDDDTSVAQAMNNLLHENDVRHREQVTEWIKRPETIPLTPQPLESTPNPFSLPEKSKEQYVFPSTSFNTPLQTSDDATPSYDPYPTSIQQTVVQPLTDTAHRYQARDRPHTPPTRPTPPVTPAPKASEKPVSPDIMNLANNTDLSIETIAREANRIQQKEEEQQDEVFISLR